MFLGKAVVSPKRSGFLGKSGGIAAAIVLIHHKGLRQLLLNSVGKGDPDSVPSEASPAYSPQSLATTARKRAGATGL
jgi:hypothetical protein